MPSPPPRPRPRQGAALFHLPAALAAALAACGGGAAELDAAAAASLEDAARELAARFADETGIRPLLSFASSGTLVVQIERAGHADVFLSAGAAEMDRLEERGLVVPGTRRTFASNRLAVVAARGGPELAGARELAGPWLRRLAVGNPESVPAGRYAREWLERAGVWDELAERVLRTVDVRGALAAVESGAADAAVVYATDAARSERVEVALLVPPDEGPAIDYPAAVLADADLPDAARSFLDFLGEREARAVLERHGFAVPGGGKD